MNGIHDMGGMHGFGPIRAERNEPLFHHDWEPRVLALSLASPSSTNADAGRHRMELIPAPDYLAMSYYERWFAIIGDLLVESGIVTAEELAAGHAAAGSGRRSPTLAAAAVEPAFTTRRPYSRDISAHPRFAPGDQVRARNINPVGHTRLPRYVRGHCGTIIASHGGFVFPDSNAHGGGENPQPLYTVSFSARELWGADAPADDSVRVDLWEPYLEPR